MLFGAKKIKCNVKYKNKKYIYELDKHNTIKDIYDLFSKEEFAPMNLSSLTIKLCSHKLPFSKNDYDTPLLSFEKDKYNELWFEVTKPYNCQECQKIISKYCLICEEYFCFNCKKNEHEKHDFIDIDPTNFKESIYLWYININANLSNDMTHFNKLKEFFQDNVLGTKIKLWKDNTIKKLNTFEKFINEICEVYKKIGNNYITKKSEELNKLMLDLSKTEQIVNNELSIGKDIKLHYNNNNYFSFDEAELFIQKLKANYNDIKINNVDIKDLSEIENFNNLNEIMGNISSQIDELTKKVLNIFNSYKNFFDKFDNLNGNNINNSILSPLKYETCSNALSDSLDNSKLLYLMKNGKKLNNKMYNIGMSKNNFRKTIKEKTLSSRVSYSTCNKTNSRLDKTIKLLNSFKKENNINKYNQGTILYNDLNLSKIKIKGEGEEREEFLYSDRYKKFPSIDKDKIRYLPLIKKI